ncbi:MAG: hypothetical protein H6Q08_3035 [Acidobacteria bacterium]|jgi:hypothetical protein|nr:hypothetical protein [Acidobacteriota bacterium]
MARGFDSKSVEYQQEEALRGRLEKKGRPLSEEERVRLQRRQTLRLARARTAADLARAASPAQQQMLGRALAALDAELKALG